MALHGVNAGNGGQVIPPVPVSKVGLALTFTMASISSIAAIAIGGMALGGVMPFAGVFSHAQAIAITASGGAMMGMTVTLAAVTARLFEQDQENASGVTGTDRQADHELELDLLADYGA